MCFLKKWNTVFYSHIFSYGENIGCHFSQVVSWSSESEIRALGRSKNMGWGSITVLQITPPCQYGYAKLQYRFAARLTKCLRCKTANISAKFAPLIRHRMFAHVRWRTCSFTKAANEQNSEHIRYVRFCNPLAKFVYIRWRICYTLIG